MIPETSEATIQPVHAVDKSPATKSGNGRRVNAALRWIMAAILIWAGLSKLVDPASFYGTMLEYRLPLPRILMKLTTFVLPWLELLCGLLMVANIARRATLLWVTALFSVFLITAGQAFIRGLDISCGCFDLSPLGIPEDSPLGHFLESVGFATFRNAVLLAMMLPMWRTVTQARTGQP